MKKLVVVVRNLAKIGKHIVSELERKEFSSGKNEEEFLEAINNDRGELIIEVNAQLPKYTPTTLAVFKDWVYWERIE